MSHLNSLVATALFLLSPLACTHGQEDWTKIDSDGDGYSVAEDCDDQNSAIYPDAQEVCDKRDNDCDGTIDEEASDAPVFYADVDGDGFGSPEDTLFSCSLPEGYTSDNNDCDDTRADVNPDADEVCDPDNTDEDCNGLADNDDDGRAEEGQTLYYIDSDQDSYGDVNDDGKGFCDNPSTETDPYSLNNEDCDDTSPLVHPGATEIWHNGLDDDCDGELDIDNLTQADARLSGVKSNDWAGLSVAVAGDVNGDGYDDVLVGGGNPFTSSGATHLVLGSSTGISDMSLADADAVFTGQRLGDYAGSSVSGAGDINADGFDDIIIGAYRDDSAGPDAGAAFIVLGRESGLPSSSLADADAILTGERAGDYAGYSVSAAGDVNGDGFDDVLVGARHESSSDKQAGSVYLINGSTDGPTTMNLSDATAKFTGESTYDLAHKVSTAGDVNGDGFADIMVGALQEGAGADAAGAVYVILGSEEASSNMSLQDADSKLNGTTKFDNVGVSVACAGDVNADGYDDLIIGAVGDDSAGSSSGAAYVVLGAVDGIPNMPLSGAEAKLRGEAQDNFAGLSVSGAGDVNADGYDDVLVGAPRETTRGINAGATYLVLGGSLGIPHTNLFGANVKIMGEAAGDYSGYFTSSGDIDGDGFSDILVGAFYADSGGVDSGAAYILYGQAL